MWPGDRSLRTPAVNSSYAGLPGLSVLFLNSEGPSTLPGVSFPLPLTGNSLKEVNRGNNRAYSMSPLSLRDTVLDCLLFNSLRTIISYILCSVLVVSEKGVIWP